MIQDHNAIADHIANWIKDYVAQAGAKGVVLGLSGGIDSALVALLCKRADVPVSCVNMPCHSSPEAFKRASQFADQFGLSLAKVDLAVPHESIMSQFTSSGVISTKASQAALRSCLRAPTLSFMAHSLSSLIIGTGNRSEDNITRYFQKYGDGCVDFSPIADLFKSEVRDLFKFLATGNSGRMPSAAQAIYDAAPSADLWGPESGQEDEKELGISYDEIEWGDREDMASADVFIDAAGQPWDVPGIVFSDLTPEMWDRFASYDARQQHVIKTLNKMEKVSRHKSNPSLPVCRVRQLTESIE